LRQSEDFCRRLEVWCRYLVTLILLIPRIDIRAPNDANPREEKEKENKRARIKTKEIETSLRRRAFEGV
jgi:hypothetical protein